MGQLVLFCDSFHSSTRTVYRLPNSSQLLTPLLTVSLFRCIYILPQPKMVENTSAHKPKGWLDDAPERIHDPSAVKPEVRHPSVCHCKYIPHPDWSLSNPKNYVNV